MSKQCWVKEARYKRVHSLWLPIYKGQKPDKINKIEAKITLSLVEIIPGKKLERVLLGFHECSVDWPMGYFPKYVDFVEIHPNYT